MKTAIWWLRRDLRLNDNLALTAALSEGRAVLPVFILDDRLLSKPASRRQAFLFAGLQALDARLRARGSRLVVRSGRPEQVLPELVQETGAEAVYAEEDFTPFARRRDEQVSQVVNLRLVHGLTIHHPLAVHKPDGSPYTVFTPFSKAWKALPRPQRLAELPEHFPAAPDVPSEPLPAPALALPGFPAGEEEAQRRLAAFLSGPVFQYADDRNRMDLDGTSALSPYFRFGMLSANRAYSACLQATETAPGPEARRGCETWINELIWREFYQAILYYFPFVLKTAFNPGLRNIPWQGTAQQLAAWQQGRTGYPVVDAAMRQLAETGWMHNRARMIVASFLVKDLLIDWKDGEAWFMQQLVDGDPAANNGGWQWTAGVGTDAAPYFRIFNPTMQGQKFDPQGEYIRRYVPELARVPAEYLHEPARMPLPVQRDCGCIIGQDYPAPIVDHAEMRGKVLTAYKNSRGL